MTCMRCRASSTAASLARMAAAGSGHDDLAEEAGRQQEGPEGEGRISAKGKKGPQRRRREPNGPPGQYPSEPGFLDGWLTAPRP